MKRTSVNVSVFFVEKEGAKSIKDRLEDIVRSRRIQSHTFSNPSTHIDPRWLQCLFLSVIVEADPEIPSTPHTIDRSGVTQHTRNSAMLERDVILYIMQGKLTRTRQRAACMSTGVLP